MPWSTRASSTRQNARSAQHRAGRRFWGLPLEASDSPSAVLSLRLQRWASRLIECSQVKDLSRSTPAAVFPTLPPTSAGGSRDAARSRLGETLATCRAFFSIVSLCCLSSIANKAAVMVVSNLTRTHSRGNYLVPRRFLLYTRLVKVGEALSYM